MEMRISLCRLPFWNGRGWTCWLLLLFCALTLRTAGGQQSRRGLVEASAKQNPLWIYEAESEDFTGGQLNGRKKVAYDRGKYRIIEERLPLANYGGKYRLVAGQPPTVVIYIFTNTRPPILWRLDPEQRVASLEGNCAQYNFAQLAKRIGPAAMQQRYHVPARLLTKKLLAGLSYGPFYTGMGLYNVINPATERSFTVVYRKVGVETVAGQKCIIYAARNAPDKIRYWVEPKSHLALKVESFTSVSPGAAPTRFLSVTRKIKFLRQLPSERFQLPQGTTAYVPETLKDILLSPGVRRRTSPYYELALFGFDPRTLDQTRR